MKYIISIVSSISFIILFHGCISARAGSREEYCRLIVKMETPPSVSISDIASKNSYRDCLSKQASVDITSKNHLVDTLKLAQKKIVYISVAGPEGYNLFSPGVHCQEFNHRGSVVIGVYAKSEAENKDMMRSVAHHNAIVASRYPQMRCQAKVG